MLDKLKTQPVTVETTSALFALLDNRYQGVPLDDGKLATAFLIMLEKVEMPPYSYAQLGDYALNYLHSDGLAEHWFMEAIEQSRSAPDYALQVIVELHRQGETRLAELAEQQARTMGILQENKLARQLAGLEQTQNARKLENTLKQPVTPLF